MSTANKLISFLLIVQCLYGCTTSKEIYYSYKVGSYTLDTGKHFLYSSSLISYGDYLFEFKDLIKMNTTVHGDSSGVTAVSYDTTGVYLLSAINKLFYEFDTFAVKTNVVKIGKFADKPSGQKLSSVVHEFASDVSFTPPKKIGINNINYFLTEVFSNNRKEIDTIKQQVVLIKNPNFNSLFKIDGIKFMDTNYCIMGFRVYDLKNNVGFVQEIESMKPLSKTEKKICANMVRTSKLCIRDSIK